MVEEPIDFALQIAGNLLEFEAGFEFYGIPGFNLTKLISGQPSPYQVETQNVSFQVATRDVHENAVVEGMLLSITTNLRVYTFKVTRPPIDDMTNWSELHVDLIDVGEA